MAGRQSYTAQAQARAENLLASRLVKATVTRVDVANKLVYLKRPGQFTDDGRGYLAAYGLVTGITKTVSITITVSGTDHTGTTTVEVVPPLGVGDEVVAVETGGSLFVVGKVDK